MGETEEAVAVVGIGCSFPGGEGLDNFWKVLVNGTNCSVSIPKERFDTTQWFDSDETKAGKSRTAKAALIDGFNEFDHKFFGISDSEVEQMDPQQKLVLHCVYRALEDAGFPMEKVSGSSTGVYLGLMNRDYETNAANVHPSVINHWTGTGLAMSIAANRISYIFNFTGPSMTIDCACSSSLVALHLACQAIKQGDCEMAVCGGVSCIIEPRVFVALSKAKMISPEGTSKPFSSRADGYGRGEGCGVVLLKPLKKALQDRDQIWGIISKTAVNQDGRSVSPITKPSMVQQEELLRRIYSQSDIANVQYVEAHGTGTPAGDPTEAGSIANVIAKARPPGSETLRIGSVKSNIGHTESAAGVAGLIKVLLMMKHETIVPSVFYSEDSANINSKALNIKIPQRAEKWETTSTRMAGVNNFGFGGTNAHAIVKQHKQSVIRQKMDEKQPKYFVVSANSKKSLSLIMEDTIEQLEAESRIDLDCLLYTAACRRSHLRHKYRRAITVSSVADLKEKLRAAVGRNSPSCILQTRLVFVFCGNGVAYHGMCKQLLQHEPVFRDKIREVTQLFQRLSALNILDTLESESESGDFRNPDTVQPLLFAIQVGVTALLRHWGARPHAMLGHSVGEVAAAHCSGLLTLEDAVKVIYYRSKLQTEVTGGMMLVISNMAVSEVIPLLPRYAGRICLAAFNSPQSCTLSGDADAIKSFHKELSSSVNSQNLFLRELDVPAAYHSHMMEPILPKIKKTIGFLQVNDLDTELFSTVTGKEMQQGDFCTGEYWARNIREPVAFEQAVTSAAKGQHTVFVEIGPRRALQRNITECLGNDADVLVSLQPQKDQETILSVIAKIFELGAPVDWSYLYRGYEPMPLPFPKYQFDCSNKDIIIGAAQKNTASNHPVLSQTGSESGMFTCDLKSEPSNYLKEHRHNSIPIIPGAFYAEMGLAAAMASAKPKAPLNSLELGVSFHSPFVLTDNSPEMKVKLEQFEDEASFKVFSSSAVYASGTVVSKKDRFAEEQSISLSSIYKRCTSVVSWQELYGYLSQGGFQYGDIFQNKADVHYGQELREAFTVVRVQEELRHQLYDYCLHPVVLDYLMQLLPVTVEHIFFGRPGFPAKIGSLTVLEPLQDEMILYLRATNVGTDHFEVCGCFADKDGRVLVEVKEVVIKYLGSRTHVVEEYFFHNALDMITEHFTPTPPPPKALVFSDCLGISNGLQQYLDSKSKYISSTYAEHFLNQGFSSLLANLNIRHIKKSFDEVLIMWGQEDLTSLPADVILQNLTGCCEVFRQIVLELKRIRFPGSIRAVTYCSSDVTADHVSPGFALVGMMRSLAAEIADLSFQLIDINSVSASNIAVLSNILRSYPCKKYPELVIKDGRVLKPFIVHTPPKVSDGSESSLSSTGPETCVLQTADAHTITRLTAIQGQAEEEVISNSSVEIQPSKICVHSSDYFPVSASHLKFGQTMYWNKHSSQSYKLLALDFSGTVSAIGKHVKKFKVGDPVACCYPVVAGTKVRVPEKVCYSTKRFPFLQKVPCVSYFVLAWEILHRALPKAKHHLGIVSSVPNSALMKVLALLSYKTGWTVTVSAQCNGVFKDVNQIDAFLLLPPYDERLIAKICNYPSAQHVVIICELQKQGLLREVVFQGVREGVHIQTIHMPDILQKGSLCAQRPHIYHWLKSLNLDRKFNLESCTFQSVESQGIHILPREKPDSYFNSEKLDVVALERNAISAASEIPLLPSQKKLFQRRAVYVVAGGLTGLGFETVKFISQRGGDHVVILSRSKPSADVQQDIYNVERQYGNRIASIQCDISVFEQVQKVVSVIGQTFPGCPIRGVFHSAVVLHDGLIETLNQSLYEKVLKPKVNGAVNLHYATQHCPLDYFVCYSSISAFLGNASQTNYGAANTFLDIFCQYRRNMGLPGQSISWGALNLGLLLNKEHFHRFLEAKGMMLMNVAEIHQSLEQCLVLNRPQQAICKFHFRNIQNNVLSQNASLTTRLFAIVEEALLKTNNTDAQSKKADCVPPKEYVVSLLSETIGLDQSELRDQSPLSSLGIDSMQAMTLQNLIFQERGVNVPLVKLLDPGATVSTVVSLLSAGADGKTGSESINAPPAEDADDVSTRL